MRSSKAGPRNSCPIVALARRRSRRSGVSQVVKRRKKRRRSSPTRSSSKHTMDKILRINHQTIQRHGIMSLQLGVAGPVAPVPRKLLQRRRRSYWRKLFSDPNPNVKRRKVISTFHTTIVPVRTNSLEFSRVGLVLVSIRNWAWELVGMDSELANPPHPHRHHSGLSGGPLASVVRRHPPHVHHLDCQSHLRRELDDGNHWGHHWHSGECDRAHFFSCWNFYPGSHLVSDCRQARLVHCPCVDFFHTGRDFLNSSFTRLFCSLFQDLAPWAWVIPSGRTRLTFCSVSASPG